MVKHTLEILQYVRKFVFLYVCGSSSLSEFAIIKKLIPTKRQEVKTDNQSR